MIPEHPWKYVRGYIRVLNSGKAKGRKVIDLVNSNTDRTTVSYARYLLAVSLGRLLTDNEEADHIDEDKTNDKLSNLQVLSVEEHKAKTVKQPRSWKHGTLAGNRYCSCFLCKEAKRLWMQEYKKTHKRVTENGKRKWVKI